MPASYSALTPPVCESLCPLRATTVRFAAFARGIKSRHVKLQMVSKTVCQHTKRPTTPAAPVHCSCNCVCGLPFCFCALHISRHVRQRCQGPFRLREGCQGHDGRQEGRQEEACVTVRPCRAAVPCRKDPQTSEGMRAQILLKRLEHRLLAVLLRKAGVQIYTELQQASGCAQFKGQLHVTFFRGVSLPTVE